MSDAPLKAHEWISFEDEHEERTYVFDLTWLESNWMCIFGRGCQGILDHDATDLGQGCCSYGAHFVDAKDVKRVVKASKRLTEDQWQFKSKGKDGVVKTNKDGETVTRSVKGACIFLNRPDFHRGSGCALHLLAMDSGESYLPLKPEVCWQVPIRREESVNALGHITTTIRQWDRADWSEGGADFHWWCTEAPEAFVGQQRAVEYLREELIALTSEAAYNTLLAYINNRRATPVPHPAVRKKN